MQRKPDINWRKNDDKKLSREVAKFNAKITRETKKNAGYGNYLPERLNVQDLKNNITTRQDFNRFIKSAERFMKKGAEKPVSNDKGLNITEWELKETQIKVREINRLRKKELEMATSGIPTERGTMGKIHNIELQPKKVNFSKKNEREWEMFSRSVEKQYRTNYSADKAEQYKANYLQAVTNMLGKYGQSLYDYVSQLDAQLVYDNYYSDANLEIDFIYQDPLEQQARAEIALETWQSLSKESK